MFQSSALNIICNPQNRANQNQHAAILLNGDQQNTQQGISLLKQAAAQGHGLAQFNLANHYYEIDLQLAIDYYKKALTNHIIYAAYNLGCAYLVQQNYLLALNYFQLAADADIPQAYYQCGYLYFYGLGTQQDSAKAVDHFNTAAQHGVLHAQYKLAYCLLKGLGISSNPEQAFTIYQKLAEQGHIDAHASLGWLYVTGTGTVRNIDAACSCFYIAAKHGSNNGKKGLHYLVKHNHQFSNLLLSHVGQYNEQT